MKTSLRAFPALIVCTAWMVGCGSPGTGSVDNYINSVAQASCDWEFRCCTAAEIMQQEMTKFKDATACLKFRQLGLEDQLYAERLAVRQGRIKVDDKQVQACLTQLNAKVCNTPPGMPPPPPPPPGFIDPCTASLIFVGNTSVGDACLFANECVKGAHCVPTGAAGEGVCVPYQEEKQICNQSTDCDPNVKNLYCAKQDYTCHLRSPVGGPCAYTIDPTTNMPTNPLLLECDTSGAASVYCDSTSMTCKQLPGSGQACLSAPLPLGATGRCDTGLICDTTAGMPGTCRGPLSIGDDCTNMNLTCNSALYCDRSVTPNTCKTLPTLGQMCQQSNYQCAKPYYCPFVMPYVCTAPAQLGQMCNNGVRCDTGLYCDMNMTPNTCKMLLPDGATCMTNQQCASMQCNFGPGGTRTCAPSTVIVQCIGH